MGKLAASILSADLAHLADQVKLVEGYADVIHIDIMDGHFVPPIALGTVVVASLRPVHRPHPARPPDGGRARRRSSMSSREAGLDMVSFHLEAVAEPGAGHREGRGRRARRRSHDQPRDAGRGRLPLPRPGRRPDADEHPARLVGPAAQPRGVSAARGGRGPRSTGAASPWSVEIDGGVKVENAQRARGRRRHGPDRRVGHLPGARPRAGAAATLGRHRGKGVPRWPRRSSSSTTTRTSHGSSR